MPFAFQAKHPWDYSCHQFGLITWFINWRADASCRSRSAVQAVLIPSGPPSVSIRDAHRMSILGPWQIFDNCMYRVTTQFNPHLVWPRYRLVSNPNLEHFKSKICIPIV